MQMIVLHGEGFNKGMASAITSQREWTDADWSTLSIIDTILAGQATEDEYTAVKLDRALATAGESKNSDSSAFHCAAVSGGCACSAFGK